MMNKECGEDDMIKNKECEENDMIKNNSDIMMV